MKRGALATLLLSTLLSCASGGSSPTGLQDTVDAHLNTYNIPGASVYVSTGSTGQWSIVSGLADIRENTPVRENHLFQIGSVTKTFTAALVLLLVEDGLLGLDDTVATHLPDLDIPHADTITIRHLLNHTSGLADYMSPESPLPQIMYENPTREFTPEELIADGVALAPDLLSTPGTRYSYSNTGYIVLGLIAQQVTGKNYESQVTERLLQPLGLDDTSVPTQIGFPGTYAHGYLKIGEELRDYSLMHPSQLWSAGCMLSTAEDLCTWARLLFGGNVLSPESMREMYTFVDARDNTTVYGLGVCFGLGPVYGIGYGHGGGTYGYGSAIWHNPSNDLTVAILANMGINNTYTLALTYRLLWELGCKPGIRQDDVVVYDSSGNWHIIVTPETTDSANFGWDETIPLYADYDGDKRLDPAVYWPAQARWYINGTSAGFMTISGWGWNGAVPVPADYDGDSRCDPAVYDRATGNWYILLSSTGGAVLKNCGASNAIPVPADYTGDGKDEPAVYCPDTGNWHILGSATTDILQWGYRGVLPAPGDYDGDAITDLAVVDRGSGKWLIRCSSTASLVTFNWGSDTTWPVPGDYDGDGITDPTVYDPSSGWWHIARSSTSSLNRYQWGGTGMSPVLPFYQALRLLEVAP